MVHYVVFQLKKNNISQTLGLNKKLTPNIFSSKNRHENGDKFKNGLSKKGVEYF
jgi:hypothetical protein